MDFVNPTTIIITAVLIFAILAFVLIKNKKDKEDLEEKIKNDYPKEHGETTRGEPGTPDHPAI